MNYSTLINKYKKELSQKSSPGVILDEIMFRYLEEFSSRYKHNHDLLMLGAILADIKLDEAIKAGDITKHVELALDYAKRILDENNISVEDQEIILEIIGTHHGGEQKFIESKIYKNADNFKFLEPRGIIHLFGAYYTDQTPDNFDFAWKRASDKLEEKISLTDLDEQTIEEAKKLYDFSRKILDSLLLN